MSNKKILSFNTIESAFSGVEEVKIHIDIDQEHVNIANEIADYCNQAIKRYVGYIRVKEIERKTIETLNQSVEIF